MYVDANHLDSDVELLENAVMNMFFCCENV